MQKQKSNDDQQLINKTVYTALLNSNIKAEDAEAVAVEAANVGIYFQRVESLLLQLRADIEKGNTAIHNRIDKVEASVNNRIDEVETLGQ